MCELDTVRKPHSITAERLSNPSKRATTATASSFLANQSDAFADVSLWICAGCAPIITGLEAQVVCEVVGGTALGGNLIEVVGEDSHGSNSIDMKLAFEYADYILYLFAIYSFLIAIYQRLQESVLNTTQFCIAFVVLGVAFTYTLARNYMVMRQIDDHMHGDKFYFLNIFAVSGNVYPFFERIVRLLIILVVILSPKQGYFKQFSTMIDNISIFIQSLLVRNIGPYVGMPAVPDYYKSESLLVLSYYGSIVSLLFLIFLCWDLVSVAAMSNLTRKGVISAEAMSHGNEAGIVNSRYLRSYLIYLNACKAGDNDKQYEIKSCIKTAKRFIFGHRFRGLKPALTYISSPKCWERIFGMVFGLVLIALGAFEFSLASVVLTLISLFCYALFVSYNERPILCLIDFLKLAFTYPFKR
jgi:hypothetical protein